MQTTLWTKCLQIEKLGQPNDVLILCTIPLNPKKWNENAALIRWIASPINLLDLNIIKGKYEEINNLNNLPCIGGTEGVGLVERIGSNVQHLCVGDLVININYWLNNNQNKIELNNIWTEWDIIPSNLLISIDKRINLASAATLGIIPPIAWTLLNDFIKLEKGDWIVQNAANSEIGKNIIQLAKGLRFRVIDLWAVDPK